MTEPVGPMHNAGPLRTVITGLLAKDPEERLDEQAARAMLQSVADAPDRPVAPPHVPSGETGTAPLPIDPQPTPTDAPPAARRSAAEQARMREALRSVRKAAAKSRPKPRPVVKPAPEPGIPADVPPPARASITDVVPRRTLILLIAAVVLALLGTVIGVAIANSGGGDGGGGGKPGGTTPSSGTKKTGHTPSSAPPSTTATTPAAGGEQGDDDADNSGKGDGKAKDDALRPGGAPAGYSLVQGAGKASVAIPVGWKAVPAGQNHYGSGTLFRDPGGAELLVDFTASPGPSALAKWQHDSKTVGPGMNGYQLIRVQQVDYRGYDTADWEYKRTISGTQMRVQNRGMVTDAHHGYALLITFPADEWNSDTNRHIRDVVFSTFKPAK